MTSVFFRFSPWLGSAIHSILLFAVSITNTCASTTQEVAPLNYSQSFDCFNSVFPDGTKPVNLTNTRAVHGISMDPFVNHRIASHSDHAVCIWDVRNFEKPVLTLQQSKPVLKISWCPTQ